MENTITENNYIEVKAGLAEFEAEYFSRLARDAVRKAVSLRGGRKGRASGRAAALADLGGASVAAEAKPAYPAPRAR